MLEIILGSGMLVTLLGWLARELVYRGRHKREHEVLQETQKEHADKLENVDKRLDEHDVLNATIITQLSYITAGIDEIKKEVKR